MRFLALHGMGTNADIFSSQLGSVLGDLEDMGHEIVFVDGLYDCKTTEDITAIYPGPYLCYYTLPEPQLVQEAHAHIHEVILSEGPFDGVIAFSHGAALASSMMLEHAKDSPHNDLFSFAVFIGASLPFDLDDRSGLNVWLSTKQTIGILTPPMTPDLKDCNKELSMLNPKALEDEFAGELGKEDPLGFPENPYNCTTTLLARYHPDRSPPEARINVPTLHVVGANDPYANQARLLSQLCDKNLSTVLDHREGHCIPRNRDFQKAMLAKISKLVTRAEFAGH